jgi:hypothetical protein
MAVTPACNFHVLPNADLIEHRCEPDDECPCGPTTQPVPRDDGSIGWLTIHHSLDGRECPIPPEVGAP